MKQIVHKLLIIACALHLSGAHWAVLQVTAWTGMLVSRTQTSGVVEAVATTFDGKHPCAMCEVIESSQKEEKRNDAQAPALKELSEIKLIAMDSAALPSPAQTSEAHWQDFLTMAPVRMEAPPTPPPLA